MALRLQAEGDAATLTRKESAYNAISLTRYSGPMRNFTFSSYVVKVSDAVGFTYVLPSGNLQRNATQISVLGK